MSHGGLVDGERPGTGHRRLTRTGQGAVTDGWTTSAAMGRACLLPAGGHGLAVAGPAGASADRGRAGGVDVGPAPRTRRACCPAPTATRVATVTGYCEVDGGATTVHGDPHRRGRRHPGRRLRQGRRRPLRATERHGEPQGRSGHADPGLRGGPLRLHRRCRWDAHQRRPRVVATSSPDTRRRGRTRQSIGGNRDPDVGGWGSDGARVRLPARSRTPACTATTRTTRWVGNLHGAPASARAGSGCSEPVSPGRPGRFAQHVLRPRRQRDGGEHRRQEHHLHGQLPGGPYGDSGAAPNEVTGNASGECAFTLARGRSSSTPARPAPDLPDGRAPGCPCAVWIRPVRRRPSYLTSPEDALEAFR